jgi:beta-galactosidase
VVASTQGTGDHVINLPDPRLWSPAFPNLYDLALELIDDAGNVVDSVKSYAGVREVGQKRDALGNLKFTLNGEEIFHWGPLDQGWWPDGLLTPPSDAAMRFDADFLKQAGFNMIRKHIKVEPRRFYYYCDRVGIMLWQDQVSGGPSPKWTRMEPEPADATWPDNEHQQWMAELKAMMDTLHNSPCIVVWVPFNEAWGQHRSMAVGKWTMAYDPSRWVNIASGGNFWPVGHIADHHNYPHPDFPLKDIRFKDFIKVVGEFGGHGLPVEGHLWSPGKHNWGYGGLPKDKDEYSVRYVKSLDLLTELKAQGIAAGIYTQTTDVEGEINGLMTYDRKVAKTPAHRLAELHQRLGPEIRR